MTRNNAIALLAERELQRLGADERQGIIEERWERAADIEGLDAALRDEVESGGLPNDFSRIEYDPLVVDALEARFGNVSNAYLTAAFGDVDGPEPSLLACPCCGFRTLERRGHYDICPVCFWEDDGSDDVARYSSPNHMTLADGRRNVAEHGVYDRKHTSRVHPEARQMYHCD